MEAAVAQQVWRDGFGEMAGLVAGCFPRRGTRQTSGEMTEAMVTGVARANCQPLAGALGHGGPHRLQHFLARAVQDHDAVRDRAARWVVHQLADDQAVLVAAETGDEKSSTGAAAAARQYSGALGGTGLCQVAVHLTYASRRGLGCGYAVAVPASHRVTTPAGRLTAASLLAGLPGRAWQRLRAGHGAKGAAGTTTGP